MYKSTKNAKYLQTFSMLKGFEAYIVCDRWTVFIAYPQTVAHTEEVI